MTQLSKAAFSQAHKLEHTEGDSGCTLTAVQARRHQQDIDEKIVVSNARMGMAHQIRLCSESSDQPQRYSNNSIRPPPHTASDGVKQVH